MGFEFEVICVEIDDESPHDDCRCIEKIGYEALTGVNRWTSERIHDEIERGRMAFYVEEYGSKLSLEAVERDGTKYVRTEPVDTEQDALLELPRCSR